MTGSTSCESIAPASRGITAVTGGVSCCTRRAVLALGGCRVGGWGLRRTAISTALTAMRAPSPARTILSHSFLLGLEGGAGELVCTGTGGRLVAGGGGRETAMPGSAVIASGLTSNLVRDRRASGAASDPSFSRALMNSSVFCQRLSGSFCSPIMTASWIYVGTEGGRAGGSP